MHAGLLRRQAFFVAVVALLGRGKVDEAMRLDWSPDRIHISRLEAIFRRRYPMDTNKNTNRHRSVDAIDRGRCCR